MKLAIQHTDSDNESMHRIIEEGNALWHDFFYVSEEDFQIIFSEQSVEVKLKWLPLSKENYDILYLKQVSSKINSYKVIAEYAKKHWVYVVDYEWILQYGEKTNTYFKIAWKLEHLSLITTFTWWVKDFNEIKWIDFPCICKPINWKEWIWVELINNQSELKKYLEKYPEEIMIQKFIKNDGDIRVYVAGNTILWAMKRSSNSDEVITNNLSTWWSAVQVSIEKDIEEELISLMPILWYSIAWFDLVEADWKFYIMEINKWWNFSWYEKFTWDNMAKKLVNFLVQ